MAARQALASGGGRRRVGGAPAPRCRHRPAAPSRGCAGPTTQIGGASGVNCGQRPPLLGLTFEEWGVWDRREAEELLFGAGERTDRKLARRAGRRASLGGHPAWPRTSFHLWPVFGPGAVTSIVPSGQAAQDRSLRPQAGRRRRSPPPQLGARIRPGPVSHSAKARSGLPCRHPASVRLQGGCGGTQGQRQRRRSPSGAAACSRSARRKVQAAETEQRRCERDGSSFPPEARRPLACTAAAAGRRRARPCPAAGLHPAARPQASLSQPRCRRSLEQLAGQPPAASRSCGRQL